MLQTIKTLKIKFNIPQKYKNKQYEKNEKDKVSRYIAFLPKNTPKVTVMTTNFNGIVSCLNTETIKVI